MNKRKQFILGLLAFCLTATLFGGVTTSGTSPSTTQLPEYDPWCDLNDDGRISITDIVIIALRFGATGTPIKKGFLTPGNVSIMPAAFMPLDNETGYYNPSVLYNTWDGAADFYASVQLPHGANITKFTIYWLDRGATYGVTCYLYRREWSTAASPVLAGTHSIAGAGYGSSYEDNIVLNPVDNNKYGYFIWVRIYHSTSWTDYSFWGAQIEYKY